MINDLVQSNAQDMPLLGMTFLQAAYLSVNLDADTFSLWKANPTTEENLIGLGSSSVGCEGRASNSPSATISSTASATASRAAAASNPAKLSHSLSSGAIAGIVVVVIVLVAAAVGAGLFMIRRRGIRSTPPPTHQHISAVSYESVGYQKAELAGNQYERSRRPSSVWKYARPYEGEPQELPVEMTTWQEVERDQR